MMSSLAGENRWNLHPISHVWYMIRLSEAKVQCHSLPVVHGVGECDETADLRTISVISTH